MPSIQEVLANAAPSQPKELPPTEFLRALISAERPSEVLPFPRCDVEGKPLCEYRMQILTQQQLDQARVGAERYTHERLKNAGKLTDSEVAAVRKEAWEDIYENALCAEVLAVAMREVAIVELQAGGLSQETFRKYPPLFTSARQIRELLTTDETAALFSAYTVVQHKYGPMWRTLSETECDDLIEKVTVGAEEYPFSGLGLLALVQLATSFAWRCRTLKIAIGSHGSDSSDTPTESGPKTSDADMSADPDLLPPVHAPTTPSVEG
ncbi:MAG: hypothetical protein WC563_15730 [Brevundimonas sp.]